MFILIKIKIYTSVIIIIIEYKNISNDTTIAGITGSATSQFNGIRYFTFDSTETYMYVVDSNNHRVMKFLTNSTTGTSEVVVAGGSVAGNMNTTLYYSCVIIYYYWSIYNK